MRVKFSDPSRIVFEISYEKADRQKAVKTYPRDFHLRESIGAYASDQPHTSYE